MKTPFVAVLMGSDSDLKTVQNTLDTLDLMDISWEVRITSAHRTPQDTHRYVEDATERGCAVFIAAAGLAAVGLPDLSWSKDWQTQKNMKSFWLK